MLTLSDLLRKIIRNGTFYGFLERFQLYGLPQEVLHDFYSFPSTVLR